MRRWIGLGVGIGLGGLVASFVACRGEAGPTRAERPPSAVRWAALGAADSPSDAGNIKQATSMASDGGLVETLECGEILVLDPSRRAVVDALVLLSEWGLGRGEGMASRTFEARTDAAGRARVCATSPDEILTVDAWDDEGRWGHEPCWLGTHDDPQVVFLADPITIAGRVVDERSRPIEGASVGIELFGRGSSWEHGSLELAAERSARTGPDGTFAIQIAEPAVLGVYAEAVGHRSGHAGPVLADGRQGAIEVVLPDEAVVSGTVLSRGRPVEHASVYVDDDRGTTTDAAGRFRIDGLDPGRQYRLWITATGTHGLIQVVEAGDHLFELEPAARLVVRAHAPDELGACARTWAVDVRVERESVRAECSTEVGEDCAFETLDGGDYEVRVEAAGFAAVDRVHLVEGETREVELELAMPRGRALLRGQVLGASSVWVYGEETVESITAGEGGAFCAAVEPGPVELSADGDEEVLQALVLRSGGSHEVTLHVPEREVERPRVIRLDELRVCSASFQIIDVGSELWVGSARPGSLLRAGDRLRAIEGETDPSEMQMVLSSSEAPALRIVIERDGRTFVVDVPGADCG